MFLEFANFYLRFIQGFSLTTPPLTSMLWTTNSPATNKSISTAEINKVGSDKVMEEYSNTKSEIVFLISNTKLLFAKLKEAFITTTILHHFNLK